MKIMIIYFIANLLHLPLVYLMLDEMIQEPDYMLRVYLYLIMLLVIILFNLIAFALTKAMQNRRIK